MSADDAAREYREWLGFALAVGLTLFELYLLVPAFRFWVHDVVRRARAPFLEARRREAEARAMMADVVELVAAGTVPPQWAEDVAS